MLGSDLVHLVGLPLNVIANLMTLSGLETPYVLVVLFGVKCSVAIIVFPMTFSFMCLLIDAQDKCGCGQCSRNFYVPLIEITHYFKNDYSYG